MEQKTTNLYTNQQIKDEDGLLTSYNVRNSCGMTVDGNDWDINLANDFSSNLNNNIFYYYFYFKVQPDQTTYVLSCFTKKRE